MSVATVRYTDEELQVFKTLIEGKLEKARNEVRFLQDQMAEANENSASQQSGDWTDESSTHTEMELLNNMLNRQRQFIQNLESALMRIQNKTYGICTMTGQLIDKKRLLLVPHATKSVEAKSKAPSGDRTAENLDKGAPGSRNGTSGKHWEDGEGHEPEDFSAVMRGFDSE